MKTKKQLQKYEGKTPKDFEHMPEFSNYSRNYYKGQNGDVLFACNIFNDDYTEWHLIEKGQENSSMQYIGYSVADEGNAIHIETVQSPYSNKKSQLEG